MGLGLACNGGDSAGSNGAASNDGGSTSSGGSSTGEGGGIPSGDAGACDTDPLKTGLPPLFNGLSVDAYDCAIVTFTAPRPAHVFGNLSMGPTIIVPIGSPDEAIQSSLNLNLTTPADVAVLLKPRPRDSNKGMYGHVLVVGGSVGKAGAAAMAGFSALRAGAGLVTVATPKSILPTVAGFHPELMTEPLAETGVGTISVHALGLLQKLAEKTTVLAIGPGISRNEESAEIVRELVMDSDLPIVLDADGLNAFEGRVKDLNRKDRSKGAKRTLVLTPHPGEMSRLTGLSTQGIQRDRINVARAFANEHGVILVLKGDRTIVASPTGGAWVNPTGNPGMATGGTGDILTGIVAGMLAQNARQPFEAVLAAGYLHDLAGDIERAIADYTKVIEIDPRNATAYENRGRAYASKGDSENANADATKANELIAKSSKTSEQPARPSSKKPKKAKTAARPAKIAPANSSGWSWLWGNSGK